MRFTLPLIARLASVCNRVCVEPKHRLRVCGYNRQFVVPTLGGCCADPSFNKAFSDPTLVLCSINALKLIESPSRPTLNLVEGFVSATNNWSSCGYALRSREIFRESSSELCSWLLTSGLCALPETPVDVLSRSAQSNYTQRICHQR
jgi:hypothetical protein